NKPIGFIAKMEITKLPIVPGWMEQMHCVFMDRSDRRQSLKAIKDGVEKLKNGHSLVIFPEGTRSKGTQMGEFKSGSLHLATKSG
ncbi:1-acyl-sn-glycerol-3-phosphate acyltransferase, partial [Pseudomonas sp. GP01-A3]